MADDKALRAQLVKLLDFTEAHVGFDAAVKGIPARLRGAVLARNGVRVGSSIAPAFRVRSCAAIR